MGRQVTRLKLNSHGKILNYVHIQNPKLRGNMLWISSMEWRLQNEKEKHNMAFNSKWKCEKQPSSFAFLKTSSFYIIVLQWTKNKCLNSYNTGAQLLFCSLNLLFVDFLFTVLVVVLLAPSNRFQSTFNRPYAWLPILSSLLEHRVVFTRIFFSSLLFWEFDHDKICSLKFKGRLGGEICWSYARMP